MYKRRLHFFEAVSKPLTCLLIFYYTVGPPNFYYFEKQPGREKLHILCSGCLQWLINKKRNTVHRRFCSHRRYLEDSLVPIFSSF